MSRFMSIDIQVNNLFVSIDPFFIDTLTVYWSDSDTKQDGEFQIENGVIRTMPHGGPVPANVREVLANERYLYGEDKR